MESPASQTTDRATSFDRNAELYDETRPGYPKELFTDLAAQAGLKSNDPVLELGAGTGRASVPMGEAGYRLTAVEPGPKLTEILSSRLEGFPGATVLNTTFEDADLPSGTYNLVFAAQSYHWLNPETRVERIARVLKPGGYLAAFWNVPSQPDEPIHSAIQACYERFFKEPEFRSAPRLWSSPDTSPFVHELMESGRFGRPRGSVYEFRVEYNADAYAKLLRTHSDHQMQAPDVLERLLAAIGEAIESHGGFIQIPYSSNLFVSRFNGE